MAPRRKARAISPLLVQADPSFDIPSNIVGLSDDDGSSAGNSPGPLGSDPPSPAVGTDIDLSAIAAAAENAGAHTPSVYLTRPSDERSSRELPALLTPEKHTRGRPRATAITPASAPQRKRAKGKEKALPLDDESPGPDPLGMPVASGTPHAPRVPSIRIPGRVLYQLPSSFQGPPPAPQVSSVPRGPDLGAASREAALKLFHDLTSGHDLLDPMVRSQIRLAFYHEAPWFDVDALLPALPSAGMAPAGAVPTASFPQPGKPFSFSSFVRTTSLSVYSFLGVPICALSAPFLPFLTDSYAYMRLAPLGPLEFSLLTHLLAPSSSR
jgi:hypothetical protein